MAIVSPTANKEELRERIFTAVQDMYTEVAACPAKGFHFPTGRAACDYVGYSAVELDAIPKTAVESFAGVGYPFRANCIRPGDIVCDIGSGAGTDMLIAARKVGSDGMVYGIDFTDAMIEKAERNIKQAEAHNVRVLKGNAEALPLPDESVNVVTSNGVLNLAPDKETAFREIRRILKPKGYLQLSDIVLSKSLSEKSRSNPQLWAECIVGAMPEEMYLGLIRSVGLVDIRIIQRIDYFAKSPNESTKNVAQQYGAMSITLIAKKL